MLFTKKSFTERSSFKFFFSILSILSNYLNIYIYNKLNKNEIISFNKFIKCLSHLEKNPRHPGLATHEIAALTQRYGKKVWQSYIENKKPASGRIYWIYGPKKNQLTIIGLEPHPDNKKSSYKKIKLSYAPDKEEKNNK